MLYFQLLLIICQIFQLSVNHVQPLLQIFCTFVIQSSNWSQFYHCWHPIHLCLLKKTSFSTIQCTVFYSSLLIASQLEFFYFVHLFQLFNPFIFLVIVKFWITLSSEKTQNERPSFLNWFLSFCILQFLMISKQDSGG